MKRVHRKNRHTRNCPPGCWIIYDHTYDTIHGTRQTRTYLDFVCPCGCGQWGAIPIATGPKQDGAWQWDGDRKVPTLSPSIFCTGQPCKWHGYFTAGLWNWCADSKVSTACLCRGKQI